MYKTRVPSFNPGTGWSAGEYPEKGSSDPKMSTLTSLAIRIGQTAKLACDGFSILVTVTDAKQSYGNLRFFVTPVSGSGAVWVDSSRVSFVQLSEQPKS